MTLAHALILSLVEGLTEFLPISSTGHLILASHLLGLEQTEFLKTFEILIQLAAILAVITLYLKSVLQNLPLIRNLLVSFIPTAIVGFLLYEVIKSTFFESTSLVLVMLILGGLALILLERVLGNKSKGKDLSPKNALFIGLAQSLSVVPGVSRAAATIMGGMGVGLSREKAVEYSFLLAVPTMLAASGLDLLKTNLTFDRNELLLLALGMAGAFTTALIAVKLFLTYVKSHSFTPFAIYRIVLAGALYLALR